MNYGEFLDQVIDGGIEGARRHYTKPQDRSKLVGSLEGFEACRGLGLEALARELVSAGKRADEARARVNEGEISSDDYWRVRCRELEIEWVANVVSAMLVNQGEKPIIHPTARGAIRAAEILGVRPS